MHADKSHRRMLPRLVIHGYMNILLKNHKYARTYIENVLQYCISGVGKYLPRPSIFGIYRLRSVNWYSRTVKDSYLVHTSKRVRFFKNAGPPPVVFLHTDCISGIYRLFSVSKFYTGTCDSSL
jgi:hypothetical protein